MPSTPFIGVRISWLIVARNWLFAIVAASAASFAARSSVSMRRASVTSTDVPSTNTSPPPRISGERVVTKSRGTPSAPVMASSPTTVCPVWSTCASADA